MTGEGPPLPRNLHVCGDGGGNVCSGRENSGLDSGQEASAWLHHCVDYAVQWRGDLIFSSSQYSLPLSQSFAQGTLTKESSAAAGRILLRDLKPISLFE